MAVVRKKQDDKFLKALRELVTSAGAGNRQCFDCGQKGPTYVNMTIGSFVCTRCSGVLRGLTPPHRVKSISMATFTQEEIDFLKAHGNELCAKTWLGLWDPKRAVHQDQRELMIDKYERKRYYLEPASPLKSLTNAASLKATNNTNNSIASTTTTTSSTSIVNNNNNNNSNLNNLNGSTNSNSNGLKASTSLTSDNSFHSIQLTPPQSQRTTANGLHKSASSSSSSVVSRPQHHLQHNNHNGYHHDAFGAATANGVLSCTLNASIGSSTGALSDTSSCASANGFGGDSDFVADFGSANIFDATSASSVGSPAVSSASSVASSNGYGKIAPILAAQHNFMMNGNGAAPTAENFADFDHAPIYNAAEIAADPRYRNYQFMRKKIIRKKKKSLTDEPEDAAGSRPPSDTSSAAQSSKAFTSSTQETSTLATDTNNITTTTTKTTTTNNMTTSSVSNLFVNFFPTPPPLPPPPPSTHHKQTKQQKAKSDDNVFLKCGITRRSSSDVIYSESTSNFNDPFDDFSEMATRNEPKPKFTPLAMAAHATAMAVLGSNYHYNSANPFERSGASTTTITTHWPTLWEESADELAASAECATPTNQPLSANTPSPCQNSFGYSLLMNNSCNFNGDNQGLQQLQSNHGAPTQMPPTFSTYLQQPVQQHQDLQQSKSSTETEEFANFSNFHTNCCCVAAAASTSPPSTSAPSTSSSPSTSTTSPPSSSQQPTIQANSNFSCHCCCPSGALKPNNLCNNRHLNCSATTTTSTAEAEAAATPTPPPTTTTNPFLANFNLFDCNNSDASNYYYDNCFAHQKAIDDYMHKFNSLTENVNYNQCNFLNAFDGCYEHAAASPGAGEEVFYDFADADAAARNSKNSTICSSCATTNCYSSYYNSVCNNNNLSTSTATCSAATSTCCSTSSCCKSTSATTIKNNLNQNQNNRTTAICGTTTRTSQELRSTGGPADHQPPPTTVDANSNCCDISFRCCPLPIPNGIHKGTSVGGSSPASAAATSANHSSNNNNLSSTPTEDRYAALKDLDEQLRESKAVAAAAASIVATSVVDSFGQQQSHQQQHQQQQQHHQHQQQHGMVVNPFQQNQQAVNAAAPQQLYGQMTVIPNGYHHLQQQQQGFFNFNGVSSGSYNGQANVLGGGPNGCGFGFGAMQQQINATGMGTAGIGGGGGMMMAANGAFNNPFAATGSMNSNNPFL